MPRLYFQLHVHSDRSHDSTTSIEKFVKHYGTFLGSTDYGVIAFTDHNTLPFSMEQAMAYSTARVLVLPGIQWKLHKTYWDALSKICTRRDVITIGNHDGLEEFLAKHNYKTDKTGEILGHLTETEFLQYLSRQNEMILTIPHPKHFIIDYYGPRQIRTLHEKFQSKNIHTPFFVEEKTGYDPFPRLFHSYAKEYKIVYASDAHEIKSFLGTDSFHSAEMFLDNVGEMKWGDIVARHDTNGFRTAMAEVFDLLQKRNAEMVLRKRHLIATVHFMRSVPAWIRRRFSNFPKNFLR